MQKLAAALLEGLIKLDETRDAAAARVARHVNNWPGMGAQDVQGKTIVAWRKQYSGRSDRYFLQAVEAIFSEPDPRGCIEGLLTEGPPSLTAAKEKLAIPAGLNDVERELWEKLRAAASSFDGGFQGFATAFRAVTQFIYKKDWGVQLAGPFQQIAAAFDDLERGGHPKLFSKKTSPDKERDRSSERKHMQRLAAALLEVLVKLDEPREVAAARIARYVDKWPSLSAQPVKGETIVAWRKKYRKDLEFSLFVEKVLSEPKPQKVIEDLLEKGPPGQFR